VEAQQSPSVDRLGYVAACVEIPICLCPAVDHLHRIIVAGSAAEPGLTVFGSCAHGRRMQLSEGRPKPDKRLLVKLAIVAVLAVVAAGLLLSGFDWRGAVERCLTAVRDAGPVAFFGALAVLPAFGFPVSPFTLSAGPVFGPSLGLPVVVAATCGALFVNVLLSYVLARWLLRPWLAKLVQRLGYRLPEVRRDNAWDIALLVRVTPGPPFFIQSYLLGLTRVPLGIYLVCSLGVAWVYSTGLVIFGDALLHGRGRMVLLALSVIVVAVAGTHLLKKRAGRTARGEHPTSNLEHPTSNG